MRPVVLALLLAAPAVPAFASEHTEAGEIAFRSALNNQPLEFHFLPDQEITEAVKTFRRTGENPYAGDADAIAAGAELYLDECQSCHLADGTGRIGPNLTDEEWIRARTDTDIGRFEIIYGGGAGAMQAFGRRLTQDQILKVMAFVDTLRPAAAP